MTIHVVHVSQPTTEGVPQVVVALVRSQVAMGMRVTVVCPDDGWLAAEASAAGAEHVPWAAQRSPGPVVAGETLRLGRILRRLRPDVVHLHSAKAGLAGRLALRGRIPTLYQPHAWSFLAVRGPLARVTLAWERWALNWSTRIICVSAAEAAQGTDRGMRLGHLVRVVPNGVDIDRFVLRDREESRRTLNLPAGPLAVCVGRLSEQKGQDILLRCWPAVLEQVPDAKLALVGDGPWRDRLRSSASRGVVFAGNRPDPRDWYAAADVIVVPSRWEGMALVPLEAAASGRSVVISDVPGARDAVPDHCGEVIRREDAAALVEAVRTRLADPVAADAEGRMARDHVASRYSLAASGARMRRVYAEVVHGVPELRSSPDESPTLTRGAGVGVGNSNAGIDDRQGSAPQNQSRRKVRTQ